MPLLGKTPVKDDGKRLKIMLYGASGVGKSTAALEMPNSYILDLERGTTAYSQKIIDQNSVVYHTTNPVEIEDQLDALLTEDHNFSTLIIDPITTLYVRIQELWDIRFQAAKGNDNKDLSDWGMRFWVKTKKDYKRIRNKILALDMNVIITCHEKEKYGNNQQIIGVCPDSEKKDTHIFDFVFRLVKRGKEYIALTEKQRIPIGGKQWPDQFTWDYKNLVNFCGEEIITKPINNKTEEKVDNDLTITSDQALDDRKEELKLRMKKWEISSKNLKSFIDEVIGWKIKSISGLNIKQLGILLDNWDVKILPKYNEYIASKVESSQENMTKNTEPELIPDAKTNEITFVAEVTGEEMRVLNINKIKLLLKDYNISEESFLKHLNIKDWSEINEEGALGLWENIDSVVETLKPCN